MKMRGGSTAGSFSASNGNAVTGGSRLLVKAAAIGVLVIAIVLLETSVVSKMHRRPSFEPPPTGGGVHQSTSYQPFSIREGNRQASLLSAHSKGLAVRGDRPPRSPVAVVSLRRHDEERAGDGEARIGPPNSSASRSSSSSSRDKEPCGLKRRRPPTTPPLACR